VFVPSSQNPWSDEYFHVVFFHVIFKKINVNDIPRLCICGMIFTGDAGYVQTCNRI